MLVDKTNQENARHKEKFVSKSLYNKLTALNSNQAVTTEVSTTERCRHFAYFPCIELTM